MKGTIMPLPTIHLLVAQKISEKMNVHISGRLLLGSIAPDAIHVRAGNVRSDKHNTHLRIPEFKSAWPNSIKLLEDCQGDPFIMGYALHIMTDYLWITGPWVQFRKILPKDMPEDEWKEYYYKDTDYIDKWFYRNPKVRKLWTIANNAPAQSLPGILTATEISRWANERLGIISSGEQQHPVGIITIATVQKFIETASDKLIKEIKKAGLDL